ncbi:MAG: DUF72 domain-containing protein [Burkholderiaceae bacterium]
MTVLIGTASWADKTLIDSGRFYPPEARTAEARLRFYSSQFPLVEVDSSYYAVPSATTARLWAERTPDDFVFNVKAFRMFTGHPTQPRVLDRDLRAALGEPDARRLYYRDLPTEIRDELWRRFVAALVPLAKVHKLGMVHFQFPPWITNRREGREHVAHCIEQMSGHVTSVEFRHESWFAERSREKTLAMLLELGAVHTVVDGPQGFANSVPFIAAITRPDHALVRLHGRNAGTYAAEGTTAAERFDYLYDEAELSGLADGIAELARQAAFTHVVFNNCNEDQGQRNARQLTRLLARRRDADALDVVTGAAVSD